MVSRRGNGDVSVLGVARVVDDESRFCGSDSYGHARAVLHVGRADGGVGGADVGDAAAVLLGRSRPRLFLGLGRVVAGRRFELRRGRRLAVDVGSERHVERRVHDDRPLSPDREAWYRGSLAD